MPVSHSEFLKFEDVGPKSPYWLDAFRPDTGLRKLAPIFPLDTLPIPGGRAASWKSSVETRERLVETLRGSSLPYSQVQWEAVDRLSRPETLVVVTGQQPGPLGGPLYTFAKVLTAVSMAHTLSEKWDIPVLPVLWNGGDDHDLEEIGSLSWPEAEEDLRFDFSRAAHQPAWTLMFSAEEKGLVRDYVESHHPPTEFRARALEFLESTLEGPCPWTEAFDRFWLKVFEDFPLLVVRPWEPSLRELAKPILVREIEDPDAYRTEVETASQELVALGYKPHIHKKEGLCSFFRLNGNLREIVRFDQGSFYFGEDRTPRSRADVLAECDRFPERFSPGALLRPVVQDAILPSAAAVLGPSEMAYHAQLGGLYQRHGIERPAIVPRFSLSLVGLIQARHLGEMRLRWPDLLRDTNDLGKRLATSENLEKSLTLLAGLEHQVHETENALRVRYEIVSAGVVQGVEAQFKRLLKPLEQLEDLLRRDEMKRGQVIRDRIEQLKDLVFPRGGLQERVYGLFPFLCRFGVDWVGELVEMSQDWDGREHVLVVLGERND